MARKVSHVRVTERVGRRRRLLVGGAVVLAVALATGGGSNVAPVVGLLAVVPLGLVNETAGDDVGRLVQAVEDLSDGEFDVEVPTHRDDDLGRLADAVDELATTLRRRDLEAERFDRYRRAVYHVATDTALAPEEKRERLLDLGCELLGTEHGIVTRIDEATGSYEVETVVGDGFLEAEARTELARTFCRKTITSEEVLGIYNAPAEGLGDDPGFEEWGISCYIGGKVEVDDGLYGTVCFVDRDARPTAFTEAEKAFVDLLARWLSYGLERRERERELQAFEEYTGNMLDAVDDVFYVLDEDRTHRTWNRRLREVTGYSDAELAEMHPLEKFVESDRDAVRDATDEAFRTGRARVEADYRTKRGDRVPYEFVANTFEDPEGNTVLAGIGRDVSERKHYESTLKEATQTLESVIEASPAALIALDEDGRVTLWNPAAERIFGWTEAEVLGDPLPIRPDDARDDHLEFFERMLDGERLTAVETTRQRKDGSMIDVSLSGAPMRDGDGDIVGTMGALQDISERKAHERELERTKSLLEQAQRLATVGGWEVDFRTDPPTVVWTDELYRLHDIPVGTEVDLEDTAALFHPDDRERLLSATRRLEEFGEPYDLELRLDDGEDGQRWVRAIGEAVSPEDTGDGASGDGDGTDEGSPVLRGSLQEITDQKEREAALRSLHDAARELLHIETTADAVDEVVETATGVLDVPGIALYLLDEDGIRLEPAGASAAFVDRYGDPPTVTVGDESMLSDCFLAATPTVFDGDDRTQASTVFDDEVENGLLLPIGNHGVFVAVGARTDVTASTRQLAETLVATTAAAFDRLDSEAELRERDAELAAQNRRLKRQIQVTDIIRGIDQSLIGADSREEIETTVCERLAAADSIAFAWIGGLDDADSSVRPRTWAGDGDGYRAAVPLRGAADAPDPAVTAATTAEPLVVENVADGVRDEQWRRDALARGYHSVVSVPLSLEDFFYGHLTVYADEPGAFGELERAVFAELGENIASSIAAVETRAALYADTVVELELSFSDADDVFTRIASACDCAVSFEGLAAHSADETRLFLSTDGAGPDAVAAVLDDLVAVVDYRLVDGDGEATTVEVTLAGDVLPARLVRHGARPRSVQATASGLTVVVHVPTGTDVREFVEMLGDRGTEVELRSRRTVTRTTGTRGELVSSLFEALTDRQLEVLRTAFLAGFFEWPRTSTGEDVAEMLDVAQPTVNRHLRNAMRRLLEQLFEVDAPAEG